MTTIINADTSGGLKLTSDTSGSLEIQSAGTTKLTIGSTSVDIPAIAGVTSINGGQVGGSRNKIINGEMKVAQRSTSETGLGAAAGYFTLDRWKIDTANSAGRLTMTQTADGPNGFANCIKLDCTTADTSLAAGEHLIISQRFEGQDLQSIGKGAAGAKEVTVSFYVKANAAFTFGLELYDADNTRQITKLYTTTTDWVRHKITFPADTTGVFTDDNLESLQLGFWLHAGSTFASGTLNTAAWANNTNANRAAGIDSFYSSTDNNFFITGIQMEIGSTATDFEHKSFGEDLTLCQRYFQKTYDYDVAIATNTIIGTHASGGNNVSPTTSYIGINTAKFTSQMRDNPTLVLYDTAGNSGKSTRFQYGVAETDNQAATVANIGTTGFNGYSASSANLSGARIHYTATSEL